MKSGTEQESRTTQTRLYLAENDFSCENCGQNLRGLNEPRCPECGEWTEVNLGRDVPASAAPVLRVGSVVATRRRLLHMHGHSVIDCADFEEIQSIKLGDQHSVKHPVSMMLLAVFLMILASGPTIYVVATWGWSGLLIQTRGIPCGLIPIGMGVAGLVMFWHVLKMNRELCLQVKTPARDLIFPLPGASHAQARQLYEFVSSHSPSCGGSRSKTAP